MPPAAVFTPPTTTGGRPPLPDANPPVSSLDDSPRRTIMVGACSRPATNTNAAYPAEIAGWSDQVIQSQRAAAVKLAADVTRAAAAGEKRFVVPPGQYRFGPGGTESLAIRGAKDFEIDATGSTFWLYPFQRKDGILIDNCRNVTLKASRWITTRRRIPKASSRRSTAPRATSPCGSSGLFHTARYAEQIGQCENRSLHARRPDSPFPPRLGQGGESHRGRSIPHLSARRLGLEVRHRDKARHPHCPGRPHHAHGDQCRQQRGLPHPGCHHLRVSAYGDHTSISAWAGMFIKTAASFAARIRAVCSPATPMSFTPRVPSMDRPSTTASCRLPLTTSLTSTGCCHSSGAAPARPDRPHHPDRSHHRGGGGDPVLCSGFLCPQGHGPRRQRPGHRHPRARPGGQ